MLRDERALGRHHFAFLRACLQGLDVKAAWLRYLAFAENSDDLRHIERRRRELLARVLQDAADTDLRSTDDRPLDWSTRASSEARQLLSRVDNTEPARTLPSLDDFIAQQGIDPDHYSQAEWLAEYRAHYGLEQPVDDDAWREKAPSSALRQAQLQALRHLEQGLARLPLASDTLARWFSPVTLPLLAVAGARTLGELLDLIHHRGPAWFRPVRGLGTRRASAIEAWLMPLADSWERALPARPRRAAAHAHGEPAGPAGRFARAQLDDPALVGDLTPVRQWLARHAAAPATHRAYTKEAERFCLWCIHIAHKPVTAINSADGEAYRRFLADVPADWIEPSALPRSHPAWRPFRGPLKPASQRHALVVVQALFEALGDGPAARLHARTRAQNAAAPAEPGVVAGRYFSDPDWTFLLTQLDRLETAALARPAGQGALPAGALQRRLRLVLCLLRSTGLRLSELVSAHTGHLQLLAQPAGAGPGGFLTINGPGPQQRVLPLPPDVLAMVSAHHADATTVGALPCPAPLVCTLRPALGQRRADHRADNALASVEAHPDPLPDKRRLGANGLYRLLKRFFARAGAHGQTFDASFGAHLSVASTHWLRHTFGEQGWDGGMSLAALQQALGHASPSSTRRYARTAARRTGQAALDQKKGEGVGPSNPLPMP